MAYSIIRNPFFRDYYDKEKQPDNKILTQDDNIVQEESDILPDFSRRYKILTQLQDYVEYKKIL
ncbi:MAG: hypothetical protein V3575_06985 [Candidatus Absconditabacteria bacterium]